MSTFMLGSKSLDQLATCDPVLHEVARLAIDLTPIDFSIIEGYRSRERQETLHRQGLSKVVFPNSKHNASPLSLAFDFVPLPGGRVDWSDTHAFAVVAGVFFAAASMVDIELRWGGDWNRDGSTRDQSFMDWGHIELWEPEI